MNAHPDPHTASTPGGKTFPIESPSDLALAATAGGLRVLTADANTPVVAKTAVVADLLKALEVVTEGGIELVGHLLEVLAVLVVLLPVEEPVGDFVLTGVLHDGDHTLYFLL